MPTASGRRSGASRAGWRPATRCRNSRSTAAICRACCAMRRSIGWGARRSTPATSSRRSPQEEGAVKARFKVLPKGSRTTVSGDVLVGCDGIHSAVRRQLYPDEAGLKWNGVLMWRGATVAKGFLDGRTMIVGGGFDNKLVLYPIAPGQERQAAHQLGRDLSHGRRLRPAAAAGGLEPARHARRADAACGAVQHAARRFAQAREGRARVLRVPDGRPRSAAALDASAG